MMQFKTMRPVKASKKDFATASKIKNKVLNTSSFFKVSLKNNNKALALALQAEKQRCMLLQTENVHLTKTVESVCFNLATNKHNYRKLLLLLKNLYSSTLKHLNMVAELFPDSGLFEPSEDYSDLPTDPNNPPIENLPIMTPDLPEFSKDSTELNPEIEKGFLENNMPAVLPLLSRKSTMSNAKTDDEKRRSNLQALQMESAHQSNSLREDMNRLSARCSQSGSNMNSLPCQLSSQTSSAISIAETPAPSAEVNAPCDFIVVVPEKTVVLNTTMEITQSNAAEIAIYQSAEEKALRKPKSKKKKKRNVVVSNPTDSSQGMDGAQSSVRETQPEPSATTSHTDEHASESSNRHPKAKSQSKLTSRIPKMVNSKVGSCQKNKITQSAVDSGDFVCPALADNVMGHDIFFFKPNENAKLPTKKDSSEQTRSNITYRKSRKKSKRGSSITSMTSMLPCLDQENGGSTVDHNEQSDHFQTAELEESSHPTGGYETQVNTESSKSQEHPKSKRRETFDVSVDHTPHIREQPGLLSNNKDSTKDVQESLESCATRDRGSVAAMPSSCKRPWVSTQDSGSLPVDLYGSENQDDVQALEEFFVAGNEFQKSKKARKEVSSISRRKKSQQSNDSSDNAKDKKKNKQCHGKGICPEEDVAYLSNPTDSPFCNDLAFLDDPDLHGEDNDIFKSRADRNSKRYRKTSKLPPPGNSERNLRQTLTISELEMPAMNNTTISSKEMSADDADEGEAARQHLGDLITDEMPPWLNISIADSEPGCVTCSPKQRTSKGQHVMDETALITPLSSVDKENQRRSRRCKVTVSYKEPSLNSKIRRGVK
ncbi:uncharacterized protein LOC144060149 isoform X2 [Vanacampus margaritifer]